MIRADPGYCLWEHHQKLVKTSRKVYQCQRVTIQAKVTSGLFLTFTIFLDNSLVLFIFLLTNLFIEFLHRLRPHIPIILLFCSLCGIILKYMKSFMLFTKDSITQKTRNSELTTRKVFCTCSDLEQDFFVFRVSRNRLFSTLSFSLPLKLWFELSIK